MTKTDPVAVLADPRAAYLNTPPPDPATPWRDADFCVVDLETTGLDPAKHEIISFAALPVDHGRVSLADARYQLIRPRRLPGPETILIHGLRSAELADAPSLDEALDGLLAALTGTVMVAHVASIEAGFLGVALGDRGVEFTNPVVDTAALARELFRLRRRPGPDPPSLGTLASALGLPVHRPHEADGDALTTAQVFLALGTHLDRLSPQTVHSMERLSRATRSLMPLRLSLRRLGKRLAVATARR